jgi:threonine/homoserine/homoserine lactone efflux protein
MFELVALLASVVFISFSGVVAPGPMLAVTLAKSYKSPLAGLWISLGHAIVEIPIILLIYFGLGRIFESNLVQVVLSIAGGAMIIYMGIDMFHARHKIVIQGQDIPHSALTAGIMMTGLNPFFLVWWATVGSMLVMKVAPFGTIALAVFILVHWLCDLVWLSFVSVLVFRSNRWLGPKWQLLVFVITSLFLTAFGTWFVYSGLKALF